MNDKIVQYSIIFLVSVLISSVSQVMLKKSALQTHDNVAKEYLNPLVIIAYVIFVIATLVHTYSFKHVPLSLGPILESTSYIMVPLLGYFLLQEKISRRKILGIVIILIGIFIFSFGGIF